MTNKIKVLVVDDDPLVRRGIRTCLKRLKNLEIIGELGDGSEVLAKVEEGKPDVVLMDLAMPKVSGLTAAALLRKTAPDIKVLILSIHSSPENLRQAMQAGARGYVLKGASAAELASAVETVQRGESYFSHDLTQLAWDEFIKADSGDSAARLTGREREILVLIAEGHSNKAMAISLGVGVRTVETHRENLMRKLDIHSAAGLTRFAVANGFVPANHRQPMAPGNQGANSVVNYLTKVF